MQRERLTPERIRRFTCGAEKKQDFLWDTDAPRLAVRATAGAKSFIFEAKLHRVTIRITVGDVKAWALDDARSEARRLQTMIDQGIDPRQEKAERAAKAKAHQEKKLRKEAPALDAWGIYIEDRKGRWSKNHLSDHLNVSHAGGVRRKRYRSGSSEFTIPGVLHALLQRPLEEINSASVREWLRKESAQRPTRTALAFRLLRAFLGWCSRHADYAELVHADACSANLAKDELPRSQAKDDCLQREQLKPWFEAVISDKNPVISSYLQTTLLVGARREEVAGMKWSDVDFQWSKVRIRDKVEGERTIPLTPYVASLLKNLKRINDTPPPRYRILCGKTIENDLSKWRPSIWVFASKTSESGRIESPKKALDRANKTAGIVGLSIHGLRRSFGSLAEWVDVPAGVVAQIQGHKPSAIAEKHYRVRPIDLLTMWHSKIETWILEQAGIEQPKDKASQGLHAVAA